ncbi:probable E3 ubiquitin-protein ligase makorin-2 [Varroa jacobsoni]|uniref:RING-type E3 ubiquitin transferase n=1 Tax=Varroa destructor TaxID=109461 RepID=A0A7M7J773_VARDE|nr:probable E3 ubiquitin-protein ligase makorin-2 [Varroa destructor]XP_022701027.1 probable E3 ubiquitin-protein ligase makorin-2 [Varroa jacobsoni]
MAEVATKSILCRYFLANACRDGNECRFSHDRATGIVDNVCRYFQKGECRYGKRCRDDHVRRLSNGHREVISRGRNSHQPRSPATDGSRHYGGSSSSGGQSLHFHGPGASGSSGGVVDGRSFADAVRPFADPLAAERARLSRLPLCEYHMISGACPDKRCRAVHGEYCDACNKFILHPHNPDLVKQHRKDCLKQQQQHAELAAAIARSASLSCGVCMETVLEKEPPSSRRFGILESCAHVFCLQCIRQWRQVKTFDTKTVRGCPECRTPSDFVTPSSYFVDRGEEKRALIEGYKNALATKPCKYFKQGRSTCPFANKCFYKHALPDGTPAPDAGPPTTRRRFDAEGSVQIFEEVLWRFMDNMYDDVVYGSDASALEEIMYDDDY